MPAFTDPTDPPTPPDDAAALRQQLATLRASEARWRGLFERMVEGFFVGEALRDVTGRMTDFRFVEANPAFERLTGIPVTQALGRSLREAIPGVQDELIAIYAQVVDTGEPAEFEVRVPALNDRWYEARARAIGHDQFSVLFLEITQRKAAETALQLSEKRFRLMADAVPQIVWITDAEGRTEFFNRQWYLYTGLAGYPSNAAEVAATVLHPQDREPTMACFNRARATGTPFAVEHRIRGASGEYRWFLVRAEPYTDPVTRRVTQWYGSSVDIHDRKLAEESLRASEARYRTLFESIDEGFCILQVIFDGAGQAHDYRFLETNPAFERHTGMVNVLGRTARELVPGLEPSWAETYGLVARTGEALRFEEQAPSMGRWFDVFAFRVGEPQERKVALLFSDVTQRKRAEQALREADTRKDEFLATLAHELRNPLAPISNGLAILRHADAASPAGLRARALMERQLAQLVRLVDDLLDVSRVSQGKVELRKAIVPLHAVVDLALETSRPLIEAGRHALTVTLPPEAVPLHADATRLAQVLGNLLNNAAKYTPEGGRIVLAAQCRPAGRVTITVSDNGIGIPAPMLGQVFDLFTQVGSALERAQGGLGIGLSLARRLVELHGGHIGAESAGPGCGSTFTVELPVAEHPDAPPALTPAAPGPR